MGFRFEDLDMSDVWALEDLTGQTMQQMIESGSSKVPYLLLWRKEVHDGRAGLTFEQWQVENAHLKLTDMADVIGGLVDEVAPEDPGVDPTSGGGPSTSPGSATSGT